MNSMVWVQGGALAVRNGVKLTGPCVRTAEAGSTMIKLKVVHRSAATRIAWAVLIVLFVLAGALMATTPTTKSLSGVFGLLALLSAAAYRHTGHFFTIHVAVGERMRARRRAGLLIAVAACAVALLGPRAALSAAEPQPWLMLVVVTFVGLALAATHLRRVVWPVSTSESFICLGGVHPTLLASFPQAGGTTNGSLTSVEAN